MNARDYSDLIARLAGLTGYAHDDRSIGAEAADVIEQLQVDIEMLRAALLTCARQAEALKRDCGMDPESAQAIRNAQYQSISTTAHIALGTIKGPVT